MYKLRRLLCLLIVIFISKLIKSGLTTIIVVAFNVLECVVLDRVRLTGLVY